MTVIMVIMAMTVRMIMMMVIWQICMRRINPLYTLRILDWLQIW